MLTFNESLTVTGCIDRAIEFLSPKNRAFVESAVLDAGIAALETANAAPTPEIGQAAYDAWYDQAMLGLASLCGPTLRERAAIEAVKAGLTFMRAIVRLNPVAEKQAADDARRALQLAETAH